MGPCSPRRPLEVIPTLVGGGGGRALPLCRSRRCVVLGGPASELRPTTRARASGRNEQTMGAPIVEYFAYTVTTPMATLAALVVSKDCPCEWHENSVQAPLHRCTGCARASQMDRTAFALGRTPGESATRPTGNGDGDSGDSEGDGALGPRYGSMAD